MTDSNVVQRSSEGFEKLDNINCDYNTKRPFWGGENQMTLTVKYN